MVEQDRHFRSENSDQSTSGSELIFDDPLSNREEAQRKASGRDPSSPTFPKPSGEIYLTVWKGQPLQSQSSTQSSTDLSSSLASHALASKTDFSMVLPSPMRRAKGLNAIEDALKAFKEEQFPEWKSHFEDEIRVLVREAIEAHASFPPSSAPPAGAPKEGNKKRKDSTDEDEKPKKVKSVKETEAFDGKVPAPIADLVQSLSDLYEKMNQAEKQLEKVAEMQRKQLPNRQPTKPRAPPVPSTNKKDQRQHVDDAVKRLQRMRAELTEWVHAECDRLPTELSQVVDKKIALLQSQNQYKMKHVLDHPNVDEDYTDSLVRWATKLKEKLMASLKVPLQAFTLHEMSAIEHDPRNRPSTAAPSPSDRINDYLYRLEVSAESLLDEMRQAIKPMVKEVPIVPPERHPAQAELRQYVLASNEAYHQQMAEALRRLEMQQNDIWRSERDVDQAEEQREQQHDLMASDLTAHVDRVSRTMQTDLNEELFRLRHAVHDNTAMQQRERDAWVVEERLLAEHEALLNQVEAQLQTLARELAAEEEGEMTKSLQTFESLLENGPQLQTSELQAVLRAAQNYLATASGSGGGPAGSPTLHHIDYYTTQLELKQRMIDRLDEELKELGARGPSLPPISARNGQLNESLRRAKDQQKGIAEQWKALEAQHQEHVTAMRDRQRKAEEILVKRRDETADACSAERDLLLTESTADETDEAFSETKKKLMDREKKLRKLCSTEPTHITELRIAQKAVEDLRAVLAGFPALRDELDAAERKVVEEEQQKLLKIQTEAQSLIAHHEKALVEWCKSLQAKRGEREVLDQEATNVVTELQQRLEAVGKEGEQELQAVRRHRHEVAMQVEADRKSLEATERALSQSLNQLETEQLHALAQQRERIQMLSSGISPYTVNRVNPNAFPHANTNNTPHHVVIGGGSSDNPFSISNSMHSPILMSSPLQGKPTSSFSFLPPHPTRTQGDLGSPVLNVSRSLHSPKGKVEVSAVI